jgi:hypothetical protein
MKRRIWSFSAVLTAGLTLALADDAAFGAGEKGAKQKPRQLVPTGAEDAAAATAEDAAAEASLERMLSRSDDGLHVVEHASGMASADLDGRYMHVSVAVTRPDGSRALACVNHPKELASVKAATARTRPAPVALEEK